ncbi:DeoR/GlpR family DNA-binding transcription regulator [Amaricoccus tamworthensis]|uniref:DeoR/GlpR family DNA-binding transcription regulator n=1 Tax=Amaricoccus tamworthensis TaxID=57002 RepID=UPI003C7E3BBF
MFAEERRQQIVDLLRSAGQVRTRELSERFGVSEVTIRTDLDNLDDRELLKKTHGGAIALPQSAPDAAFDRRMQSNADAKHRIGRMAAQQLVNSQSVIFDSGSTTMHIAMHMPQLRHVMVATPAMNIAQMLMDRPGLDVHMLGGRVDASTVSTLVGPQQMDGLLAHQVFMAAHAIDSSFDIVDQSEDVARSKRNLMQMARRVVLVVDSTKWDVGGPSKAFPLSRVDLVITDSGLPAPIRKRLRDRNIDVLFA